MKVVFAGSVAALMEGTDVGSARLPVGAIMSARRKLTLLRALPDSRSLRNWKSLRHEELEGSREGQQSIQIDGSYRMIFSFSERADTPTITVFGIEGCA